LKVVPGREQHETQDQGKPRSEAGSLELGAQRPLGDGLIGVHQQVAAIEDRDGQQVHEADADRQAADQQHQADEEAQHHRGHIGRVGGAGLGHGAGRVADTDQAADLVGRDLSGDQAPQIEADRGDLVSRPRRSRREWRARPASA
jgi:hypothetical protein